MDYVIIHKKDIKSKSWQRHNPYTHIKLRGIEGSGILFPFLTFLFILRFGRPRAFIFRYLNDYKSSLKSFLIYLADLLTILLLKALNIKIIWLCHNVDKESVIHYPKINHKRRMLLKKHAHKVFVTDPLLVPHIKDCLQIEENRLDYTVFGEPDTENMDDDRMLSFLEQLKHFHSQNKSGSKVLFGKCSSDPLPKKQHFEKIPELIRQAEKVGYKLFMVVIRPKTKWENPLSKETKDFLENDPRVLYIPGYVPIREKELKAYIDFEFIAYNDLSVPYTLYTASAAGRPIISMDIGFAAEAVAAYKIGFVLQQDFGNLNFILEKLKKQDNQYAEAFLKSHNWATGAERLLK
jgi:glycosyltransferase involved in cell wall biosynthesis